MLLIALFAAFQVAAQDEYLDAHAEDNEKIYRGGATHEVIQYPELTKGKRPRNVIFLIADGTGISHIQAAMIANKGKLFLGNFHSMGLVKTHSASDFTTDSAAGGTALSTGKKTNNGAIAVDPDKKTAKTILEDAEDKGMATGLVSTSAITHATPASFIAHQSSRKKYEDIAADFLKTDIEVFIGGGYKHFTERKDGRNLVEELRDKGYRVEQNMDVIQNVSEGKLAGLTAPMHNDKMNERGDMLPKATNTAIRILSKNRKGFFLMVEGSQIDWGGHANSTSRVVEELLDFDRAVGVALDFAARDKRTLVVVTSDHETGGMTILDGNPETGMVRGEYSTGSHTGMWVPVFAWGPGSDKFTGIMENTEVHDRMKALLTGK